MQITASMLETTNWYQMSYAGVWTYVRIDSLDQDEMGNDPTFAEVTTETGEELEIDPRVYTWMELGKTLQKDLARQAKRAARTAA